MGGKDDEFKRQREALEAERNAEAARLREEADKVKAELMGAKDDL